LRDRAGLTLDQMAERLSTSRNTYHDVETGKTRLSLDWMRRIAGALGCAPSDLMLPEDQAYVLDQQELELLGVLRKLPADRRALVPKLLSALQAGDLAPDAA
jgi:transcriptional regulator with XRE-family HTH domain